MPERFLGYGPKATRMFATRWLLFIPTVFLVLYMNGGSNGLFFPWLILFSFYTASVHCEGIFSISEDDQA